VAWFIALDFIGASAEEPAEVGGGPLAWLANTPLDELSLLPLLPELSLLRLLDPIPRELPGPSRSTNVDIWR